MADLPQELIVDSIFTRLPVKSLIRFTCVAKWLRSIILYDPRFAKTQLKLGREHKTLARRLLFFNDKNPLQPRSLDLQSFGDVRNMNFPLQRQFCNVSLIGSCNGLIFVMFDLASFLVWNPATGFSKELPCPGFPKPLCFLKTCFGVGYLSATDNYKICVSRLPALSSGYQGQVAVFSSRAKCWTITEVSLDYFYSSENGTPDYFYSSGKGTLVHETLHWLISGQFDRLMTVKIVAFDLEKEEFRKMKLPSDIQGVGYCFSLGVSLGGCLSLSHYLDGQRGPFTVVDLWVMREYDVCDSWTRLFKLNFSSPLYLSPLRSEILVVENGTVAAVAFPGDKIVFFRLGHTEEVEELDPYITKDCSSIIMIAYEESLVWINDYDDGAEEKLQNPSQGLTNQAQLKRNV